MDKGVLFKINLEKKKATISKALLKSKDARDNAPGAMESASDTRRSQAEKLVVAFESELKDLTIIEDKLSEVKLVYFEVLVGDVTTKYLIVPDGMGGAEIDGVRLISSNTMLGSTLLSKKVGGKFDFNGQKMIVLKIE